MSYSGSFFAFSLEGDWTNEPHRSPLGPSQDSPSSEIGSKGFKKRRLLQSSYLCVRLQSNKIDGGTGRRHKNAHYLQTQEVLVYSFINDVIIITRSFSQNHKIQKYIK